LLNSFGRLFFSGIATLNKEYVDNGQVINYTKIIIKCEETPKVSFYDQIGRFSGRRPRLYEISLEISRLTP